jgi:hypothetical protein
LNWTPESEQPKWFHIWFVCIVLQEGTVELMVSTNDTKINKGRLTLSASAAIEVSNHWDDTNV